MAYDNSNQGKQLEVQGCSSSTGGIPDKSEYSELEARLRVMYKLALGGQHPLRFTPRVAKGGVQGLW